MEKTKAEVSHCVTVLREGIVPNPKRKLLDQVREVIRLKHYSIRTEESYVDWIKRYIFFHGKRHPREMGAAEIESFLTDLAVQRRVAASTQNQALNALVFLYREVLHQEAGEFSAVRAKRPIRLPTVLSKEEVQNLLTALKPGTLRLMTRLLYGTGMRLMECVRLRVKDVVFEKNQIIVREGKGQKDRVTVLPASLKVELEEHLRLVKLLHARDLAAGFGDVYLPYALAAKYPAAGREWAWQYVFPAAALSLDPRSGAQRRHHACETGLQRAVKEALRLARISPFQDQEQENWASRQKLNSTAVGRDRGVGIHSRFLSQTTFCAPGRRAVRGRSSIG